jgi:hypothetical protein
LIGCAKVPTPVTRTADPRLLELCAAADQLPAGQLSDNQVAAALVDYDAKLRECSARHAALVNWEKAAAP